MLNILGMIILIIILFIIFLLIIGIKITFEFNKTGSELKGCLKILILKKIKIYHHTLSSSDDEDKTEDAEDKKEKDYKKLFDLAKPCFKYFKDYIKSAVKVMKIAKIENHLIFGMDSFSDTGKYIGVIWAILAVINPLNKNIHLTAEPRFSGSIVDGYGKNELEIYPLKLLVPTIKLILKKEVRIFIRSVLDERWFKGPF